jgi:hypothetical protein
MCAYASPTLSQITGKVLTHMHVKPRSYLTAGIAALGVGAIALAPVQPIPDQLTGPPERMVNTLAVSLAAAVDPIQAWVDTFETTFANIGILGEFYMQKPFPLLQTIAANTATYAEEAANGQGDLILGQIWGNIVKFFEAPWSPGVLAELTNTNFEPPTEAAVPSTDNYMSKTQPATPASLPPEVDAFSPWDTNLGFLQIVAGLSITADPNDPDSLPELWELIVSPISPIWRFLATPYSGQVLSWLGPLMSPVMALTQSFTAVGEAFAAGEVMDALYELINIPANMTNAFLNGAGFLNLTPVLAQFFEFPEGFPKDIQIGFNMGGLLNAMPQDGSLKNPDDPPTVWAGGVGFDSFAIPGCSESQDGVCAFIRDQPFAGLTNGLFGAGIGLGQFLADQLLVTPPPPAEAPAAVEAASTAEAPAAIAEAPAVETAPAVEAEPAVDAAPAVVEVSVEDSAPALVEVVAEDPAPAVEDIAEIEAAIEAVAEVDAAIESVKASAAEPAEAATPAAEDSGPEAADDDKSDDDTDRSGSKNRRGAN